MTGAPQTAPLGNETAASLLSVKGVKKHFGGVKALDGVDFSLRQGEVHALVGENGAGKSTLIKVLSGVFPHDLGAISLDGRDYRPEGPSTAKSSGVQVVHQEFNLLDHLSIAENISIEQLPKTKLGLLNRSELKKRARTALDAIGLSNIDVTQPVSSLGIAHRQLVEIARALQSESKILILDEPTATLTERETGRLFEIVSAIKAKGVTVVFVSHHLNEVFTICDRITVFRNGKTVCTVDVADTTPVAIIEKMVGRQVQQTTTHRNFTQYAEVNALEVENLCTQANKSGTGLSFQLKKGEILGIAGLVGSGRTEILRGLFGLDRLQSGKIYRDGVPLHIKGPRDAIAAAIGFVTEDRKDEGLILDMPIAANVSLVNLGKVSQTGILNFSKENRQATRSSERLKLKYGKLGDPASSLSGGNQQKVVLAKWLAGKPQVLLLDEPTRGVDVGAKAEIYTLLKGLAEEGMSLLVVSSEIPELMTLADRILVLSEHQIQGELLPDDYSEQNILKLAYGHSTSAEEQRT
ncbi:sugar ABC transporter ATP-binding protein [Flexibacterium corallicola]|uniref:sugar ABC transporter ATP-binding protein n=1 Tax=Flexibacterium corallicola TaxID=3037259 RepID=UPI00286F9D1F|nr:sugar ABC transporter ATP-binding protein [Pseudovibrio sp. M1P-2-3]